MYNHKTDLRGTLRSLLCFTTTSIDTAFLQSTEPTTKPIDSSLPTFATFSKETTPVTRVPKTRFKSRQHVSCDRSTEIIKFLSPSSLCTPHRPVSSLSLPP